MLAPPAVPPALASAKAEEAAAPARPHPVFEGAPTCSECGMLMMPNGNCYKCENCGSTSGC
jgi:ribonucleoside-diphosphate reductase alpha chain